MTDRTLTTQVEPWQKLGAGALSLVAAVALMLTIRGSDVWKLFMPLLGLVAAAIVIHRATLGAQLVARAIWWANLGLASILCLLGGGKDIKQGGAVMALACGLALLVIGRKGLAEASERANYAPPAFRSSLLLLMVLGLADAQTFLLFAFLDATDHSPKVRAFLPVGLAYLAGFVGLYRLAIWGALLNLATSAAMFLYLLGGGLSDEHELRAVIYAVCGAQLLVSVPLGISLLWKRPLFSLPPRARIVGANVAVVSLVALDLVGALVR